MAEMTDAQRNLQNALASRIEGDMQQIVAAIEILIDERIATALSLVSGLIKNEFLEG